VQPVLRLEADLGNEVSLVPLARPTFRSVAISPDGTRLVYVGIISGGPPKLLTRRLDQPNATELPGTEGAMDPFFSRDGQWAVPGLEAAALREFSDDDLLAALFAPRAA